MTDQHRATPEQWAYMHERTEAGLEMTSCILELRARIEALEADQLEQAESGRFCTDAIVRRVETLEAYDKEDANCWAMVRSGMHALRERIEALEAAQQDKLDRLIALDAADPTPDPAMAELRAASAEARPAGGLVERVTARIEFGINTELNPEGIARAVIREQAAWLSEHTDDDASAYWAARLEQEANQ